jgi:predicted porin
MKHSLLAVALLGAFAAGTVQAQTSVQIYGTVDAGVIKRSGENLNIGKRASNTLGFKGTEELGNGLKALFQLEMRYEPDTGTNEIGANGSQRPLFQGQSRVGLQGDFGMVRIGRGLTPFHETVGAFEPFHASPSPAGFWTDLAVAGYSSQPLEVQGYSNNRFSNGVWYNSQVSSGFQLNAAIATKESGGGPAVIGRGTPAAPQYPVGAEASANPFSITGTYNNGPAAFMAGYEGLVDRRIVLGHPGTEADGPVLEAGPGAYPLRQRQYHRVGAGRELHHGSRQVPGRLWSEGRRRPAEGQAAVARL